MPIPLLFTGTHDYIAGFKFCDIEPFSVTTNGGLVLVFREAQDFSKTPPERIPYSYQFVVGIKEGEHVESNDALTRLFSEKMGGKVTRLNSQAFNPLPSDPTKPVWHGQVTFKPANLPEAMCPPRMPLITILDKFFDLDPMGYFERDPNGDVKIKTGVDRQKINKFFKEKEEDVAKAFHAVANAGDVGYAEEIRSTLSGLGIGSSQVDKMTGKAVKDPTRPHSFVPDNDRTGIKDPSVIDSKSSTSRLPAYMDRWRHAIYTGYRAYRHSQSPVGATTPKAYKGVNRLTITPQQEADYIQNDSRIRDIHQRGTLLGRVANLGEARDFMSERLNMGNDILSTTLWPKEGSPLQVRLFCEYGAETVGVLLDSTDIGPNDRGVSFYLNAGTVNSGFKKHQKRRNEDGVESFDAQRQLLADYDTILLAGGSVSDVNSPERKTDGSGWELKPVDAKTTTGYRYAGRGSAALKSNEILWNEQTVYRGAIQHAFRGLFIKSDSDDFAKSLKNVITLQSRIREKKGIFVPIYIFKPGNKLEELVPDALILSLVGLTGQVAPVTFRRSRLTEALNNAGITVEIAEAMSQEVNPAGAPAAPQKSTIKRLTDLQLLSFNMTDITSTVSSLVEVHGGFNYEPVRILDNLHLIFPTVSQTRNQTAKCQELYFSEADITTMKRDLPNTVRFFQLSIKENLKKFLGITVDSATGGITFDPKVTKLFGTDDPLQVDFAKTLSRAMQCAVLFDVFGAKTADIVKAIVAEIRQPLPKLGISLPGDMILGSMEMQKVIALSASQVQLCDPKIMEKERHENPDLPMPVFKQSLDHITPLSWSDPKQMPSIDAVHAYLYLQVALNEDFSLSRRAKALITTNPTEFDQQMTKALKVLCVLNPKAATDILGQLRKQFSFGYSAEGRCLITEADPQVAWILAKLNQEPPKTEFPYRVAANVEANTDDEGNTAIRVGIRGLGRTQAFQPFQAQAQFGRGRRAIAEGAYPYDAIATPARARATEEQLKEYLATVVAKPLAGNALKHAIALGFTQPDGRPLWAITPIFHDLNKGKPDRPYLETSDVAGAYFEELMSGPALDPQILAANQQTVRVLYDASIRGTEIQHFVCDTLLVTTNGDHQVTRLNGFEYSNAVTPPTGGNIEFSRGNEKHKAWDSSPRSFMNPPYKGAGGYTVEQLKEIEAYDQKLLTDVERRRKAHGLILSAYITATATGGYNSPRVPLDRARTVLLIDTAGPQFEKYGNGDFTYQDGPTVSNELDVADYITKDGEAENAKPLFPHYYPEGKKLGHTAIKATPVDKLGDKSVRHRFVELKDGSYYDRAFAARANLNYLTRTVQAIQMHTQRNPVYLKATLFGGGFFAQTGKAGDLREEVVVTMLRSYTTLLTKGAFPKGSCIEFPRYGKTTDLPVGVFEALTEAAKKAGVDIVWNNEGDLLNFDTQTTLDGKEVSLARFEEQKTFVVLNAGDAMSAKGNEKSSASVEAMLGNNTNMRFVFNWYFNPLVLEESRRTPVK